MIEKLNKRTKKAIVNNLQKLIGKYGLDEVRVVVNRYFQQVKEKKNLEEDVARRERELAKLKRSLI